MKYNIRVKYRMDKEIEDSTPTVSGTFNIHK